MLNPQNFLPSYINQFYGSDNDLGVLMAQPANPLSLPSIGNLLNPTGTSEMQSCLTKLESVSNFYMNPPTAHQNVGFYFPPMMTSFSGFEHTGLVSPSTSLTAVGNCFSHNAEEAINFSINAHKEHNEEEGTSLFIPELEPETLDSIPGVKLEPRKRGRPRKNPAPTRIPTRLRIVTKPPEEPEIEDESVLIENFLSTCSDSELCSVINRFGNRDLVVEWKKTDAVTMEPAFFRCYISDCRFKTESSGEIVNHFKTFFDCSQCQRQFHTENQLEHHAKETHLVQSSGRLCEECGLSLRAQAGLDYHKLHSHYICPVCFLRAEVEEEIATHLRDCHESYALNAICDTCSARFLTIQSLTTHEEEAHGDNSDDQEEAFNLMTGETTAMKRKHKLVTCQICGKKYSAVSMRVHIRRYHKKEKRFQCEFCNYEAFDTFILREHVRRHLGEYVYRCNNCEFAAVKKYQLDSHMRRHSGEKPFKCDQCEYSAAWNVQLKGHMQAHSSATRETCHECDIVFKDIRGYKRHYTSVHQNGGFLSTPKKRKTPLRVKLIRTSAPTSEYSFSRERLLSLRLRKGNDRSSTSPEPANLSMESPKQLIVVNKGNPNSSASQVTCRPDGLIAVVSSTGPSSSQEAFPNYTVLSPEML